MKTSHRFTLVFDTDEEHQFMLQRIRQAEKDWEAIKNQHNDPAEDQYINRLGLSVKLKNLLTRENLLTIRQVLDKGNDSILRLPGMGKDTINQLRVALAAKGYELK